MATLLIMSTACNRAPETPARSLRVAFDLWPGYFPAHVAKGAGIFDSVGAPVELDVPENTGAMLADFSAGRYDIIIASVADVMPVIQRMPDVRLLFCTDESAGADAVMAREGIARVAQLRGRRIGVKFGGFAELLVRQMIAAEGVAVADVELVNLDASAVPAALDAHIIDAGETWEPYLTQLRARGYGVVYSSAEVPGLIVQCAFSRADLLERRKPHVQAFVDSWFVAQERLLADPAAGVAIVAKELARPPADLSLAGVRFLDRAENRRRLLDQAAPFAETLRRYEQFFGELGQLRRVIDVERLIDRRFIR